MRVFRGPNLVCLSRSVCPPILGFDRGDDADEPAKQETPPDVGASDGVGTKAELCGFSGKSSLNLSRLLSSLDWSKLGECLHVTLTYHHQFPRNKEGLSKHKYYIQKLVGRNCEAGIWRLEFQERGAPHFHLLVWLGDRFAADFETWLREWWGNFASNSARDAVYITSGDQARGVWYLAMHAGKDAQAPEIKVGRWWGYINRSRLLDAQSVNETGVLSPDELKQWARLSRRHRKARARQARAIWRSKRTFQRAFGFRLARGYGLDLDEFQRDAEAAGKLCTRRYIPPYRKAEQGLSWFLPLEWQWKVNRWVGEEIDRRQIERTRHGNTPF